MEDKDKKNPAAVALGRLGGRVGGPARARKLTSAQRSEIARHAAKTRWDAKNAKGENIMEWSKQLTASEAIRVNQGAPMPFIRCTQAGQNIDHRTWFRSALFAQAGWTLGQDQRESIAVPFDVFIGGERLGTQMLQIDYDPYRDHNHSAPTVHIHYNRTVEMKLESVDMTGHILTITSNNGSYALNIS